MSQPVNSKENSANSIELSCLERAPSDLATRLSRIHEAFEATIPAKRRIHRHHDYSLFRSGSAADAFRLNRQLSAPMASLEEGMTWGHTNNAFVKESTISRVFDVDAACLPGGILHPLSPLRLRWDFFITILVLAVAWFIPFRIGFFVDTSWTWFWIDRVFDLCFILDILVNFHTGYRQDDVVIIDRRMIALHYLRGWFFVDFIATLPFELLIIGEPGNASILDTSKLLKLSKIARLLKLMRLFRLRRVYRSIGESLRFRHTLERLANLVLAAILVAHWCACVFHFIGVYEASKKQKSWLKLNDLNHAGTAERYITSVYWAMATMTTVGYGDVLAVSLSERVFSLFVIVFGAGVFAYVITNVVQFIGNSSALNRMYQQKMDLVNAYLKFRRLSAILADRIRVYHQLAWNGIIQELRREKEILEELPPSLRHLVAVHVSKHLISKSSMFFGADPDFIMNIRLRMTQQFVCSGEFIYFADEVGDTMYLILTGEVEVIVKGSPVRTLTNGQYFGFECVFEPSKVRQTSVRAKSWLSVLALKHEDLLHAIWNHPEMKELVMHGWSHHPSNLFLSDDSEDQTIQKPLMQLLAANYLNLRNQALAKYMFVPAKALHTRDSFTGVFDMAALQDTMLRLDFAQCVEAVSRLKRRIDWLENSSKRDAVDEKQD